MAVWLLPLVTLLLSGKDVTMIKIPFDVFSTVNVEYICPLVLSTDLTEILFVEIIKSTIRVVVTDKNPPPAIFVDVPITSFGFKLLKSKFPPSDVKTADETSGSLGSWENEKEKSETESQAKLLIFIVTLGENAIQGLLPVNPPTQFPQLSTNANPFGVLWQSTA